MYSGGRLDASLSGSGHHSSLAELPIGRRGHTLGWQQEGAEHLPPPTASSPEAAVSLQLIAGPALFSNNIVILSLPSYSPHIFLTLSILLLCSIPCIIETHISSIPFTSPSSVIPYFPPCSLFSKLQLQPFMFPCSIKDHKVIFCQLDDVLTK